jgi:hypothetical protein
LHDELGDDERVFTPRVLTRVSTTTLFTFHATIIKNNGGILGVAPTHAHQVDLELGAARGCAYVRL